MKTFTNVIGGVARRPTRRAAVAARLPIATRRTRNTCVNHENVNKTLSAAAAQHQRMSQSFSPPIIAIFYMQQQRDGNAAQLEALSGGAQRPSCGARRNFLSLADFAIARRVVPKHC